jgi:hypothetical protein
MCPSTLCARCKAEPVISAGEPRSCGHIMRYGELNQSRPVLPSFQPTRVRSAAEIRKMAFQSSDVFLLVCSGNSGRWVGASKPQGPTVCAAKHGQSQLARTIPTRHQRHVMFPREAWNWRETATSARLWAHNVNGHIITTILKAPCWNVTVMQSVFTRL